MRISVRAQESGSAKELGRVFRVLTGQLELPPEEPCRRCIRLYGFLSSESSKADDSINDGNASAGYAAEDVLTVADSIIQLAELGCIPIGFKADVEQARKPLGTPEFDALEEDYSSDSEGKKIVEGVNDEFVEMRVKVLDEIAAFCQKGTAR